MEKIEDKHVTGRAKFINGNYYSSSLKVSVKKCSLDDNPAWQITVDNHNDERTLKIIEGNLQASMYLSGIEAAIKD